MDVFMTLDRNYCIVFQKIYVTVYDHRRINASGVMQNRCFLLVKWVQNDSVLVYFPVL